MRECVTSLNASASCKEGVDLHLAVLAVLKKYPEDVFEVFHNHHFYN